MHIFTNNDYKRIQAWLKANAIKDSEFTIIDKGDPEDTVVIVHDNNGIKTNYSIKLKNLLADINNVGGEGCPKWEGE